MLKDLKLMTNGNHPSMAPTIYYLIMVIIFQRSPRIWARASGKTDVKFSSAYGLLSDVCGDKYK